MGFGAARAERLPGMALVGLVSSNHARGIGVAADAATDAVIISGVDGAEAVKKLAEPLSPRPWGARVDSLSEGEARAHEDSGSDLLVFNLDGTAASALASEEIARVLCVEAGMDETQLRAIASLPVDAFLVPMTGASTSWTLRDLATVGAISRRVDKYILVEVSQAPGKKDLEALRDIGVNALVLDVGVAGADKLKELRTALMEMPRPRSNRDRKSVV